MMLVHKPQALALSAPNAFSHRRHPSAPVLVQPTRTPGLLSLSKPPRPTPARRPELPQRQAPRQTPKPTKAVRAQPQQENRQAVTPPRGRTQGKKDKVSDQRSASQSAIRKHGRQPSPPLPTATPPAISSQAEVSFSNSFDPFLDQPASPTLNDRPSGKLAQRRQPTKAIPVPAPASAPRPSKASILSRSDPPTSTLTRQRPRPLPQRSTTIEAFPVCDDSNDSDMTLAELTPRRLFHNGPQTAPISARAPGAFPFVTPSPNKKAKKHQRTPSEGVFQMSSDDEAPAGPATTAALSDSVKMLFGLHASANNLVSPFATPARAVPRSSDSSDEDSDDPTDKAGYFASSMFQNSPSPDELPDPLLL